MEFEQAMDRTTALNILESVRPGTSDEQEPEVQEALRVVRNDPEASRTLVLRRRADRRIAEAMSDVPVPTEARTRLLAELAALNAPGTAPASDALAASQSGIPLVTRSSLAPSPRAKQPGSRGLSRPLAAALALSLVALGFVVWSFRTAARPLATVDELALAASAPAASPLPFPDSASVIPQPPSGSGWRNRWIEFDAPQQVLLRGAPADGVAAWPFAVAVGRGQSVHGWLVVSPISRVTEPPPATSFAPENAHYSDGRARVAWTEGDFVYVCIVRGGDDALRQIERALGVRLS